MGWGGPPGGYGVAAYEYVLLRKWSVCARQDIQLATHAARTGWRRHIGGHRKRLEAPFTFRHGFPQRDPLGARADRIRSILDVCTVDEVAPAGEEGSPNAEFRVGAVGGCLCRRGSYLELPEFGWRQSQLFARFYHFSRVVRA